MLLGTLGGAAAVFAHVQFSATLLVLERELNLMHFIQVRLQAAALSKLAIAFEALKGTHARMRSSVTFQVKRVVEALLTKCAQVPFWKKEFVKLKN